MKKLILLALVISGSVFAEYKCTTEDMHRSNILSPSYDQILTETVVKNCDTQLPHSVEVILGQSAQPQTGRFIKLCCTRL